jgi:hypothetical protein
MSTNLTVAGAHTSRVPSGWLAAAACVMLAHTAHAVMSVRSRSSAQCRTVALRRRDTVSSSETAISNSGDARLAGNCAIPRSHLLVSRDRTRTRRAFQLHSQNDLSIGANDHLQLSLWGAIVAPREPVQPVIFLSAETTRGPPPAPYRCASPFLLILPFPIHPRRATTMVVVHVSASDPSKQSLYSTNQSTSQ